MLVGLVRAMWFSGIRRADAHVSSGALAVLQLGGRGLTPRMPEDSVGVTVTTDTAGARTSDVMESRVLAVQRHSPRVDARHRLTSDSGRPFPYRGKLAPQTITKRGRELCGI